MSEFDRAAREFTLRLVHAADWRNYYFGASYTTRIREAIKEAREACKDMERALKELTQTTINFPFMCSICQKSYTGYGNNAQPVNNGRCCDDCNSDVVIPTRLVRLRELVEEGGEKED